MANKKVQQKINLWLNNNKSLEGTNSPPDCEVISINNEICDDLGLVKRPFTNIKIEHLMSIKIAQPKAEDLKEKKFPIDVMGKDKRSFHDYWYVNRWWLTYSISKNRMFCFPCFVFFNQSNSDSKIGVAREFSVTGSFNWKNGVNNLKVHEQSEHHIHCCTQYSQFKKNNISSMISSSVSSSIRLKNEKIRKNREILKRIIDTIALCAKNNLAFRGNESKESLQNNPSQGCFKEILNYLSKYDSIIFDHLKNGPKNALYFHGTIINEILEILSNQIIQNLLKMKDKDAPFGLICDETKDITNIEQLSVCIRFINSQTHLVEERFIGFEALEFTNAEAITNAIITRLKMVGLDLSYCRAQTYDGASVMSGHENGVQAKIRAIEPKAIYIHCFSHILDLCMKLNEKNEYVYNLLRHLNSIRTFFNGVKRNAILKNCIDNNFNLNSNEKKRRLQSFCETRWHSHFRVLENFLILYEPVVFALETLADDGFFDSKTTAEAKGFLRYITSFECLITCQIVFKILSITKIYCDYLQSVDINLSQFKKMTKITIDALKNVKTDENYQIIFEDAIKRAEILNIHVPSQILIPGRGSKFIDTKKFFREKIFDDCLIFFLNNLNTRISEKFSDLISSFCIFSKDCMDYPINAKSYIDLLYDFYHDDFNVQSDGLFREYEIFSKWYLDHLKFSESIENSDISTTTKLDGIINDLESASLTEDWNNWSKIYKLIILEKMTFCFQNVFKILKIFLSFPISSNSAERSFSQMKLIKNYLRSSMTSDRLCNISIIRLNKDIEIDYNSVIDEFSSIKERRVDFF